MGFKWHLWHLYMAFRSIFEKKTMSIYAWDLMGNVWDLIFRGREKCHRPKSGLAPSPSTMVKADFSHLSALYFGVAIDQVKALLDTFGGNLAKNDLPEFTREFSKYSIFWLYLAIKWSYCNPIQNCSFVLVGLHHIYLPHRATNLKNCTFIGTHFLGSMCAISKTWD